VNTGVALKIEIIIEERGRLGSEGRVPDGSVLRRDVISLMSEQAHSALSILGAGLCCTRWQHRGL
jgi:hypothetical protein